MTASDRHPGKSTRWIRALGWLGGILLLAVLGIVPVSWWLTEPLEPTNGSLLSETPAPPAKPASTTPAPRVPDWPGARLEGPQAKRLLLETLLAARRKLDAIPGYTAKLRKQERIAGKLGDEQLLAMKVRHQPFAIYFKFLAPSPGKEIVYAEGLHDNKMIAHGTGVARLLVPRLAVPPDHPLALADNRHPVTEAGLVNLTEKLIGFRKMDLNDQDARTILDRTTGPDGREWLRSVHIHARRKPERPFARSEVLYDPDSRFPLQISNYDWPSADHSGELLLAERYRYDDLDLDVSLTSLDFDPANPAYAFHRY
jgi:hypothetical protein